MNDSVENFISRIEKVSDKYYKSLLLRGFSLFVLVFVSSLVIVSFFEYLIQFSQPLRFFLLVLFTIVNAGVFAIKVCKPFLQLFNILPRLSYSDVCRLIQLKYPELQDIPFNIIELSQQQKSELTDASIKQKISKTLNYDFSQAVSYNFKSVISYLLFALTLLSFLILLCPSLFSDGFFRIIYFHKHTENINVLISVDESKLLVEQGSDLRIKSIIHGNISASEIYINFHSNKLIMEQLDDTTFEYLFKNVNNEFNFSILAGDFESSVYRVKVLKVPTINSYNTELYFPKYVNKRDTIVDNQNILIVPQGTFIKQNFIGVNFDTLRLFYSADSTEMLCLTGNDFVYKDRILNNQDYFVVLSNADIIRKFIDFKIVCVPDLYPELSISKSFEQYAQDRIVFNGSIKDDYGFSHMLMFVSGNGFTDTLQVPIYQNVTSQQVYYDYSFPTVSDITDQALSFSFELYDNDSVNGPKKVQSDLFEHIVKSISSQTIEKEKKYADLFKQLELSKQFSSEIEFDIAELRKKLLNDNLTVWEKTNMLQQISSKTNQLQDLLNEISKAHNSIENTFSKSQQIIEKQNLISEMLNNLVDDELKQILNEILQLANEQQQYNTLSEDLKRDFSNFEKSIDKDLELLKKIKMEENMQQLADNLKVLSDKQNQLSFSESDSLTLDVDNQQSFFNDLQNQYNQMNEENQLLERPFDIGDFQNQFEQINNNFNLEKQQLNNGEKQNFKNISQENSNQIKQLSKNIENLLKKNVADSHAEDADDLRQILDNLFEISFNQERIITDYDNVNYTNPLYQDRILEQSQLVENFKIVRDSLYNLSRRSEFIGNHISKAAFMIEDGMTKACLQLQERNTSLAGRSQRESLKNANDLILILSESLKNIDNASASSGVKSSKRKKKPSDQKQSLSDMRGAQESLKNQMRDLLNQMKNGNTNKTNRELMKALMQNEIYQQMLEQMMYNADIDSQTAKLLQEVKQLMEKTHTELSNKKLSIQTVMRQQNIVTKLLEAENAEAERDKDDRRESTLGKNITRKTPENWTEDITFEKNIEFLKQTDLRLNSFYKNKFEEYLNVVNKKNNE